MEETIAFIGQYITYGWYHSDKTADMLNLISPNFE